MKILTFRSAARLVAVTLFAALALAAISYAQDNMGGYSQPPPSPIPQQQMPAPTTSQPAQKPAAPAAPPVNLKEQADYKALFATS